MEWGGSEQNGGSKKVLKGWAGRGRLNRFSFKRRKRRGDDVSTDEKFTRCQKEKDRNNTKKIKEASLEESPVEGRWNPNAQQSRFVI